MLLRLADCVGAVELHRGDAARGGEVAELEGWGSNGAVGCGVVVAGAC